MMLLTTPEPTVRPPSREFSRVFSHVFNVFSGILRTKSDAFLHIIYIIRSSWHRFGTGGRNARSIILLHLFPSDHYIHYQRI